MIQKVCIPEPVIQLFLKHSESLCLQINGTSPALHHGSPPKIA